MNKKEILKFILIVVGLVVIVLIIMLTSKSNETCPNDNCCDLTRGFHGNIQKHSLLEKMEKEAEEYANGNVFGYDMKGEFVMGGFKGDMDLYYCEFDFRVEVDNSHVVETVTIRRKLNESIDEWRKNAK